MNTNDPVLRNMYAHLDKCSADVQSFISKAKSKPTGEVEFTELANIQNTVTQINKVSSAANLVFSQNLAKGEVHAWSETEVLTFNENLDDANYEAIKQKKYAKYSKIPLVGNLLAKFTAWIEFRKIKKTISHIDLAHFQAIIHQKQSPTAVPSLVLEDAIKPDELAKRFTDLNLEPNVLQGTYHLSALPKEEGYLLSIKDNTDGVTNTYSFTWNGKEANYAVYNEKTKSKLGTVASVEEFIENRQISLAKSILINNGDFVKIESIRTNAGKNFIVLVKTADGIQQSSYLQPNTVINPERKQFFNEREFFAAMAQQHNVLLAETSTINQIANLSDAPRALKGKKEGSWVIVAQADPAQPKYLAMVVPDKSERGQAGSGTIVKAFAYAVTGADEFTANAPGAVHDLSHKVMTPASIQARQMQSTVIGQLKQMASTVAVEASEASIHSALKTLVTTTDLPPFVVRNKGGANFLIKAAPIDGGSGVDYQISHTITVLEGGRIGFGDTTFSSFRAFLNDQHLGHSLTEALVRQTFGEPVKRHKEALELSVAGVNSMQLWTTTDNLEQSYLTVSREGKVSTYKCERTVFDEAGKPQIKFSDMNEPIPFEDLATYFNASSKKQIEANKVLEKEIMPEIPSNLKSLLTSGKGYVLTKSEKANTYMLSVWDAGYGARQIPLLGLFVAEADKTTYEVSILPSGEITENQQNRVVGSDKVYANVDEFLKSLESTQSIRQLAENKIISDKISIIKQKAGDAWCDSKSEAVKLLGRARSYQINANGWILYPLASNEVGAVCYKDGKEQFEEYQITKEGKGELVKIATLPLAKDLKGKTTTLMSFAESFESHPNYLWTSSDAVRIDFQRFDNISDNAKAGIHAYTITTDPVGAKFVVLTYFDPHGKTRQVTINRQTKLGQSGLVKGKTINTLQNKHIVTDNSDLDLAGGIAKGIVKGAARGAYGVLNKLFGANTDEDASTPVMTPVSQPATIQAPAQPVPIVSQAPAVRVPVAKPVAATNVPVQNVPVQNVPVQGVSVQSAPVQKAPAPSVIAKAAAVAKITSIPANVMGDLEYSVKSQENALARRLLAAYMWINKPEDLDQPTAKKLEALILADTSYDDFYELMNTKSDKQLGIGINMVGAWGKPQKAWSFDAGASKKVAKSLLQDYLVKLHAVANVN